MKTLRNKKLTIVSLHSEFCSADPLTSRLLSFVIPDDYIIAGETFPELMKAWVWSWEVLASGKHPSIDHTGKAFPSGSRRAKIAGNRLCGPFTFCFAGAVADWSFHSKFWYPFIHGSSHNFICSRCMASRVIRALRIDDHTDEAGFVYGRFGRLCNLPKPGCTMYPQVPLTIDPYR